MNTTPTCTSSFFADQYGHLPSHHVLAPGRINLIGEHVDYNGGFVLPAAIDKSMSFYMRSNSLSYCRIYAVDLQEEIQFDIHATPVHSASWSSYFTGIWWALSGHYQLTNGIDCIFGGHIPVGAGVSSSSAIECGFLVGLNEIFGLSLSNWDMIEYSQASNHHFLGVPGGFMDQFIILNGRAGYASLLDCQNRTSRPIPLPETPYTFVLIDSKVAHDHLTSGYSDRVHKSQDALRKIQRRHAEIQSLRDITLSLLDQCRNELTDEEYEVTLFFIEENARVIHMVDAMQQSDVAGMGQLLYASHAGLRDLYRVSCPEVDFLVDQTRKRNGILGARMMGGGFGGCTINLMEKSNVLHLTDSIANTYKKATGIQAEVYQVTTTDGVKIQKLLD